MYIYLSILVNGASDGNSSSERKRKMADMLARKAMHILNNLFLLKTLQKLLLMRKNIVGDFP